MQNNLTVQKQSFNINYVGQSYKLKKLHFLWNTFTKKQQEVKQWKSKKGKGIPKT